MPMLLQEILRGCGVLFGNIERDVWVESIVDDSRRVQPGCVFVAVTGSQQDGLVFAQQALLLGAAVVVSDAIAPTEYGGQWVQVENAKLARLRMVQNFYKNPFASLMVHGVTGTCGKTTTAFLMEGVLHAQGYRVALIGTVCMRIGKQEVPAELTTPGIIDLHAFAAHAVAEGCTHLVMEVSSHSLHQGRVDGIEFHSTLFSNLSRDHLDYHKDFDEYFAAKMLLFTHYRKGFAIVNVDDSYGEQLANSLAVEHASLVRVSRQGKESEVLAYDVRLFANGIEMRIPQLHAEKFESRLCGDFNADNLLLVAGWAYALGLSIQAVRKAFLTVAIPGRFEMVYSDGGRHVVVDYAHKPDALERVLQTARSLCKRKLLVVLGCGGDRDKGKRPLMGAIAENWCDMVFVTSDNPRTEDPESIVSEIVAGMQKSKHAVLLDRATAIQVACRAMDGGDWLVVAGKGHETYQIIGLTKYPFDDRKVVREAFQC